MDQIRSEEHDDYVAVKADLEKSISGVGKALDMLKEYYGGTAALPPERTASYA